MAPVSLPAKQFIMIDKKPLGFVVWDKKYLRCPSVKKQYRTGIKIILIFIFQFNAFPYQIN